jgi:sugar phosphate isomerase/epimerase
MSDSTLSPTRRGFLGVAAGAGIGVATASMIGPMAGTANAAMSVAAPGRASNNLGLQLFSVRSAVSSLGFRAVFEELARIGFTEVEFAGYTQGNVGPITVQEIRQLLDDNGLKAIGSHIGLNNLLNAGQREVEFERARVLGMPFIGTASNFPGETVAEVQAGAERFNAAGEVALREYGLRIYQHNHSTEFSFTADQPDTRRYDVFLAATDPRYVFLEMDILWAFGGARRFPGAGATGEFGFDPAAYVVADPTRYPLFHTKDGTPLPLPTTSHGYDPTEFGAGTIPFRDFFNKVGARTEAHPLWEQDNAPSTPASQGGQFGAALRSYNGMHAMRTLTWLDELERMITGYADTGRLKGSVAAALQDRLSRATSLVEQGSETRAAAYVEQLVAKANNQIKGDEDDLLVRSMIVDNARSLLTWLGEAEDRENAL